MRIGIDARFYGPRVGGGGIGRYVSQLVTHLQQIDDQNQYVLFLKKENFHECVITNPRFEKRLVDVHWYGLEEQVVMPREVRRAKVDFMHYPHFNVPVFSRVPFVVTIHDLILIEDKHSARTSTRSALVHGFKYAAYRLILERAIHGSAHILTVSNYTKKSLLKHFGVKEKKITVIHNGVQSPLSTKGTDLYPMGVYDPYFLYVGNAYPHKNLEMLMHAFARYREQDPYAQLVIAGRRDVFSRKLEREAKEIGIPSEQLRFIDLPTDAEIASLYAGAKLFIFPSRIEGFGIPPLEAMSYGTPVAAAHATSLPEVLGPTAHYFKPDDIEALVEIMMLSKQNPKELARHIAAGLDQARSYQWKRTAEETLAAYQRFPLT
jgi:glycosyltransferase involved in cell wall biosynthesis